MTFALLSVILILTVVMVVMRGRRTILTPELQESICSHLRRGRFFHLAVELSGMTNDVTAWRWMRDGRKDFEDGKETAVSRFLIAVTQARAEGENYIAGLIEAAMKGDGKGDWRGAAWWLSRLRPEYYADRAIEVRHSGEVKTIGGEVFERLLGQPGVATIVQGVFRTLALDASNDGKRLESGQVAICSPLGTDKPEDS